VSGVFNYEENNLNSQVTITTKQATDHRQITLLETEWRDIKRFSNNIKIEKQSFDWLSLLIGATISTVIPLSSSAINYFSSYEISDLKSVAFYSLFTIVFLIASLITACRSKCKSDNLSICKVHHDNLCLKIDEIDNRINTEPFGQ